MNSKVMLVIVGCFCVQAKVANIILLNSKNVNTVSIHEDAIAITKRDDNNLHTEVIQTKEKHDPKVTTELPVVYKNRTNTAYETDNENETLINKTRGIPVLSQDQNVGEPLILTPLIKAGKINLARTLSKVDPRLFLGLASHSGFLTVDEKYNSNLFFWYFPVPEKSVAETPWVIWLQGGPGVTSMVGLFSEIGPFRVEHGEKLKYHNETWGKSHSLLFIDNPVGTGYSFTNNSKGFAQFTNVSSVQLYSAVQQFLQLFPELRTAPLYIAGESYAGKYIPGLAKEIHGRSGSQEPINVKARIHLKGLAIGNGFVDPSIIGQYSRIAYHFGIIDEKDQRNIEKLEREYMRFVNAGESVAAKNQRQIITDFLQIKAMQAQLYNVLENDFDLLLRFPTFLEKDDVKRAIHVGSAKCNFINFNVNTAMSPDFVSNYRLVVEQLLENYRVLMFSGLLDMMVPYVLTAENIRTWRWSGRQQFLQASRSPWIIDNKLAGYYKSGGNLTEVMVRNSGHMVPADQPVAARVMMEHFTSDRPLNGPSVLRAKC